MIHIYYGDGKGKTTAALGLALRACGAGKKVLFISFLKDNSSCERMAQSGIEFYKNPDKLPFPSNMTDKEKRSYSVWMKEALGSAFSSDAEVVVLDEFLDAATFLDSAEMNALPLDDSREYIITGHIHNEILFDKADYITEMKKIKHPYDKGVKARKGIEF